MEEIITVKGIRYVPEILLKQKEAEIRELTLEIRRLKQRELVSADNHG